MHIGKFYHKSCNTVLSRLFSSVNPLNPLCLYVCIYTNIIIIQARTQTFEKGGANLRVFTKGCASLKKILILRPKLGV